MSSHLLLLLSSHTCQPFPLATGPFLYPYLFILFSDTLIFNQNCLCYQRFVSMHWNLLGSLLGIFGRQRPHCPKDPPVANNSAEKKRQSLSHDPLFPWSMICYWQAQSYIGTKSCYEILCVLYVIITIVVFYFKDRITQPFFPVFQPWNSFLSLSCEAPWVLAWDKCPAESLLPLIVTVAHWGVEKDDFTFSI